MPGAFSFGLTRWPIRWRGVAAFHHLTRGNDLVGSDALLDPGFERFVDAVVGVIGGRIRPRTRLAEVGRPGTVVAMVHARHHEEPHRVGGRLGAHRRDHAVVILDGRKGRDGWIVPPLIQNQLAARGVEGGEIGHVGVDRGADGCDRVFETLIDIEVGVGPLGILVDHVGKKVADIGGHDAVSQ